MKRMSEDVAREAAAYLSDIDPVLRPIVARAGLCTIRPHTDYYRELVESIISQQLSVKAAATILRRFCALFACETVPPPQDILTKDIDELRTAGLSRGKALYVRDLAQHVVDGKVHFDHLDGLSNDQVIAELTAVKGVGVWTAHMFLMFCMGRTDVLPTGDLGIRSGMRKLYGLAELPAPTEITQLALERRWHPYESVASWYVWHSLDNMPAVS